jgi:fumarylacetoacetase
LVIDADLTCAWPAAEGDTTTIGRTSSKHLLWSFPQMIAHHTLGGCPMRAGDLLGSGTISGPGGLDERGSLLEMTENGKKEVLLAGMDARTFLKDGDTVTLRGSCGADGARVGFGECRGRIHSAGQR